jgi:hypothetical protein
MAVRSIWSSSVEVSDGCAPVYDPPDAAAVGVRSGLVRAGAKWLRRNGYVVVPVLFLVLYAAPLVVFQLPSYQSTISEEYQPLKALKFFHSRGTAFAKWGPVDDLLLASPYGVTLGYWWIRGKFGPAQTAFPYGFHEPLEQLSALILEGRLVLLAIGAAGVGILGALLARAGAPRWAVCVALLACVATNPVIISYLVILKPDAPMVAFLSVALGLYVLCSVQGATRLRLFGLSTATVLAVSSKEIAAPMLLLPCVAAGLRGMRSETPGTRRATLASAAWGLAFYAVLNVVYAPATWLERMKFWVADSGADGAVWGHPGQNAWGFALEVVRELVENLGPGGMALAGAGLVTLALLRRRLCWDLILPAVSFTAFGLARVGYVPSYFCIPIAISAVPMTAFGLATLREWLIGWKAKAVATAALLGALGANAVYANLAWIQLGANVEYLVEQHALSHLRAGTVVSIFSFWPRPEVPTRLERLGFHVDRRGAAELIEARANLPEVLYVDPALKIWLEELRDMPMRAKMIEENTGFRLSQWPGFEGLGYELTNVVEPAVPFWYPFSNLPRERADNRLGVLVYRRRSSSSIAPQACCGSMCQHAVRQCSGGSDTAARIADPVRSDRSWS